METAETPETMEVGVSSRDARQFDGDALVVGVVANESALEGTAALLNEAMNGALDQLLASGEQSGATGDITLLHTLGKLKVERIALIGLGPRDSLSVARLRRAAAIACRSLRKAGARRIGLALASASSRLNPAQAVQAATEGAILGLYSFTRYKSASSLVGAGKEQGRQNKIDTVTI